MKVTGGTATAVRAWAVEQYQVAVPSGSAVAGIAVDTHHAPGAKVPGAGWSSQLFSLTCQSVPGSLPQDRSTYCRYGVLEALGLDRGLSGMSTWGFVLSCFFSSLPRSGWGRNSATDGPTRSLSGMGVAAQRRQEYLRTRKWLARYLAAISTAHGALVAPLWTIMDNVAS
jgi:hypothetical protein